VYLDKKREAGRVIAVGSAEQIEALGVHCSPLGIIPKKDKVGSWRLIMDLSFPASGSVHDRISTELSFISYISMDEVKRRVLELGNGAQMAKANIKQAYRNVPVHPDDRLLNMQLQW